MILLNEYIVFIFLYIFDIIYLSNLLKNGVLSNVIKLRY